MMDDWFVPFMVRPMQDRLKELWGAVGNEEEVMKEEVDSDEEGMDWDEILDEELGLRGEDSDSEESYSEESDSD